MTNIPRASDQLTASPSSEANLSTSPKARRHRNSSINQEEKGKASLWNAIGASASRVHFHPDKYLAMIRSTGLLSSVNPDGARTVSVSPDYK